MPWIKKLHEKELAGTISEIEKKELKARKEVLFNSIKKFGYSLVQQHDGRTQIASRHVY